MALYINMTPQELRRHVEATGSVFFKPSTMRFFGDTMGNYGVREATVVDINNETVECWELYRRKPVKERHQTSAYFNKRTFKLVHLRSTQ